MRSTNWHVITGAPCSGKTSVIDALRRLGYQTVHETARSYIDQELRKGSSLAQIKADELSFENYILHMKHKTESSLPPDQLIFFDRAIPDSIAYFRLHGFDPSEAVKLSKIYRYRKIFLFDRLQYERDPVRSEDDPKAAILDDLLEEAYRMLNYDILRVPLMSIKDRVKYVLRKR